MQYLPTAEPIAEKSTVPGVLLTDDPDIMEEDPDAEDPDYDEDPDEEGPDDEELDVVDRLNRLLAGEQKAKYVLSFFPCQSDAR
jgi:hypothetical protein